VIASLAGTEKLAAGAMDVPGLRGLDGGRPRLSGGAVRILGRRRFPMGPNGAQAWRTRAWAGGLCRALRPGAADGTLMAALAEKTSVFRPAGRFCLPGGLWQSSGQRSELSGISDSARAEASRIEGRGIVPLEKAFREG